MPDVALEDAQLHYEEHGAGDALVLRHNFSGVGVGVLILAFRMIVPLGTSPAPG